MSVLGTRPDDGLLPACPQCRLLLARLTQRTAERDEALASLARIERQLTQPEGRDGV